MSRSLESPRVYRTEAIVLKGYNYGEADRILTLCTPHAGKVRVIAKGVRRTKSRMGGHLDLLTRSTVLVARGRQLDIVTQAETIENFRALREDLSRGTYASYIVELVDSFSADQLGNYPVYALTVTTLRRLADSLDLEMVTRAFELQLLAFTGYRPQLHHCLNCDKKIEPIANRFSAKLGGVLCPDCADTDAAAPEITVDALKVLRNLQTNEAAMLHLDPLSPDLRGEVERRLHDYVVYRLEGRPRSLSFLHRLRHEGITPA
ncbi:MAG: DNA repair protein RecO [Chloroflexota bacterium]